jgi:hypothetical protein
MMNWLGDLCFGAAASEVEGDDKETFKFLSFKAKIKGLILIGYV